MAGYSPTQPFPEEWEFRLPQDQQICQVRSPDKFGASWRGIEIPFTRLYKGYDPRIISDLKKMGIAEDAIEQVKKYESPVVYDGMPVQDAINFVVFILQTTIGISTFEIGVPSCGGPLQVATVLPDTGFQWVKEPNLHIVE